MDRLKKAVRANVVYYAIVIVCALIGLAAIGATGGLNDRDAFTGTIMTLANLFGLSLVVILLSYGLVDVPRTLWHAGDSRRALRYHEFLAPKVKDALNDADAHYDDVHREILAISKKIRFHDDLRPYVDLIMATADGQVPTATDDGQQ